MAGRHLTMQTVQGVRAFSSSASAMNLVKAPVAVFGIEGRYATALYSAASKQKALDAVEKDLDAFSVQLKKDTRLREFILDPSIKKNLKVDGVAGACDKMKMNPLTKNMLTAMTDNNRYNLVSQVAGSFKTIMAAHRGEVVCEITTAKPLDSAMSKEVEAAIASMLKSGQKSQITYSVDPAIIGGMVVSIGDKFVDMSMASKLKRYEEIIKSAA